MAGTTSAESSAAAATPQEGGEELLPGGFHPFRPVLHDDFENKETNLARPLTSAVITVRVIKSFAYRSMKALVLKDVDLTSMTVEQLEERCRQEVAKAQGFKAFRTYAPKLDTLKIYTRAHGAKTTNLIINLDHPEWVLDQDKQRPLVDLGLGESRISPDALACDAMCSDRLALYISSLSAENEAELSFFNREEYEAFLVDPTTKW